LLVGLLQLPLLGLQLRRRALRLLEQAFGCIVASMLFEHDADAGRQLLRKVICSS